MNHQTNFKHSENSFHNAKKISCDGGSLYSKHPLIFLNVANNQDNICPYCGKNFSLEKSTNNIIKNSKTNKK